MAREARKTAIPPKSAEVGTAKPSNGLVVRHYCQGIGDCHLLKFAKDDGTDFWMLIDCGLHSSVSGSYETIDTIVDDIALATGGHIDVLVVTHEHWDHVSGFLTAGDKFAKIKVDTVWMGWTEDPKDPDAVAFDKYKAAALGVTQKATLRLNQNANADDVTASVRAGLQSLAGLQFGAKGEKVRSARDAARSLVAAEPVYLEPTTSPFMLDRVPGVRVYVLGPPRDKDLLKLTARDSEMYGAAAHTGWAIGDALSVSAGLTDDAEADIDSFAPFDPELGTSLKAAVATGAAAPTSGVDPIVANFVERHYSGTSAAQGVIMKKTKAEFPQALDQSWRRIDDDWLYASADLAMQIDSRTNNTSLVLAFEFTETGRIALFAADAQVGSWLSWQNLRWTVGEQQLTGPDLLARTVYYKVSHHGSENATLKQNGLEQMTHPDLSAFVPTNARDAAKVGWHQMPFSAILDALSARTSGRTVRADDEWIGKIDAAGLGPPITGSIRSWSHSPGLWVEISIG